MIEDTCGQCIVSFINVYRVLCLCLCLKSGDNCLLRLAPCTMGFHREEEKGIKLTVNSEMDKIIGETGKEEKPGKRENTEN